MLFDFPCLKQTTELNCLPTCIRSVLLYLFEEELTVEQASFLCQEEKSGGCQWDKTVSALQEQGYSIENLTSGNESPDEALARLYEAVQENDIPVILQWHDLHTPFRHAVVVVGFWDDEAEIIGCMNPDPTVPNRLLRLPTSELLQKWERTDFTAFYFL